MLEYGVLVLGGTLYAGYPKQPKLRELKFYILCVCFPRIAGLVQKSLLRFPLFLFVCSGWPAQEITNTQVKDERT